MESATPQPEPRQVKQTVNGLHPSAADIMTRHENTVERHLVDVMQMNDNLRRCYSYSSINGG